MAHTALEGLKPDKLLAGKFRRAKKSPVPLAAGLAILFLASCGGGAVREQDQPIPVPVPPPLPDYLTLVAVGDNLFHNVMIRPPGEGGYNFDSYYEEIKPLIKPADIAFINQETLLAGEEFGYTGYPSFNTPQEAGRAILNTGFDVINHSTNHIMDKGEKAVFATMDFWDSVRGTSGGEFAGGGPGFPLILGIHRSEEERNKPALVEKNNIRLGFLSYTYGTNGIPVPKDKPYLISLIDTEIMAKEIDALRPLCDFLIVSMHWGNEYQHQYSKAQKTLAEFLAGHQVDLVIGHHPHVIQPFEYVPRPEGGSMLCFYSLGNFISAQTGNPTLLGALMYVRLKKESGGEIPGAGADLSSAADTATSPRILIEAAGVIPMVTHYEQNFTGFKVYPLYNYTEKLTDKHWKNRTAEGITLDGLNALAERIFPGGIIGANPFAPRLPADPAFSRPGRFRDTAPRSVKPKRLHGRSVKSA
jgi:poly-gamma-glutamate synthesis protein (capsule biosynthesis protein)